MKKLENEVRKVVIKVRMNEKELSGLVTPPGFEPRQTESESVVLPLYYGASVHLFSCRDRSSVPSLLQLANDQSQRRF